MARYDFQATTYGAARWRWRMAIARPIVMNTGAKRRSLTHHVLKATAGSGTAAFDFCSQIQLLPLAPEGFLPCAIVRDLRNRLDYLGCTIDQICYLGFSRVF